MGVMGVMGANGVTGSSGITEAIGVMHTIGVTDAHGITHTNDVARANGLMGAAHVPGAAALRASDEVLADAWPAAGYGERRAAQVIMDAEPSLVLGEQPEWPHDPQAHVLAQWGPTTVTKAEPVTVIDAGAPRPDGLARHEPAPRKPVWRKRTAAGVVLLLALGAGGYVSLRHGAGPGGQGAREPQAIKLGAPPVAR